MFFMAEYANMITVSCLATILFFGGWLSPFPDTWTWQLFLPGVGLIAARDLLRWSTRSPTMRGIARLQFAVVTLLCLGGGALCLIPAVAVVIQGAVLVHRENSGDPVLLHLDARHAAALPLRPADVLRLEAAAAGVARESGGHERRRSVLHHEGPDEPSVHSVFRLCAARRCWRGHADSGARADSQRAGADSGDDLARRALPAAGRGIHRRRADHRLRRRDHGVVRLRHHAAQCGRRRAHQFQPARQYVGIAAGVHSAARIAHWLFHSAIGAAHCQRLRARRPPVSTVRALEAAFPAVSVSVRSDFDPDSDRGPGRAGSGEERTSDRSRFPTIWC